MQKQWIVLSGLRNLKIAPQDGAPSNEYRIQQKRLEADHSGLMASAAKRTVGKAVAKRVSGSGAGPVQSFLAAAVVGAAAAALAYRLLRSGG